MSLDIEITLKQQITVTLSAPTNFARKSLVDGTLAAAAIPVWKRVSGDAGLQVSHDALSAVLSAGKVVGVSVFEVSRPRRPGEDEVEAKSSGAKVTTAPIPGKPPVKPGVAVAGSPHGVAGSPHTVADSSHAVGEPSHAVGEPSHAEEDLLVETINLTVVKGEASVFGLRAGAITPKPVLQVV